jgi:hypothetical protein
VQELLGAVVDPFGSGTPVLLELVDDLTEARGDVPLDGLMGVLGGPLGTCASFGPSVRLPPVRPGRVAAPPSDGTAR